MKSILLYVGYMILYLPLDQFFPETHVIILIGKLASRPASRVFPIECHDWTHWRSKILQATLWSFEFICNSNYRNFTKKKKVSGMQLPKNSESHESKAILILQMRCANEVPSDMSSSTRVGTRGIFKYTLIDC